MHKKLPLLLIIMFLVLLISGCGVADTDEVKLVKEGNFTDYPDIKIGAAFDKFFSDGKWKSFKTDKGESIVEFTGKCMYMEKEINVVMQFNVKSKVEFEAGALEFNEIPQNALMRAGLISKIFESYTGKDVKNEEKKPMKEEKFDISGNWEGRLVNSSGEETIFRLYLKQNADGSISGWHRCTWSNGKRLENTMEENKATISGKVTDNTGKKYSVNLKGTYSEKTSGNVVANISVINDNKIHWEKVSSTGENYIPGKCDLQRL